MVRGRHVPHAAKTETACRREEIVQIIERYLAAPAGGFSRPRTETLDLPATIGAAPATPPGGPTTPTDPDPAATPALKAEQPDTSGSTTYGVFGISNSSESGSAGVAGYAKALTGEVGGVAGFNDSVQGYGVYGENSGTTGGIGVLGRDEADSGITAGVVGLTANEEGYGALFWHEDGGDALVVADPALHPASVDVRMFVDVDGNLGLVGVVKFAPTDSPTESCAEETEGAVYYDKSERSLCVCWQKSFGPDVWVYRRTDNTADCS